MLQTQRSYEADFDQEYEALAERHANAKQSLEANMSSFLSGSAAKPVTIQGPYGAGKTQLLYHLFKYIWRNDGIAIYVHLEQLIPDHEMAASAYADYLRAMVNAEVERLKHGKSHLMFNRVAEHAIAQYDRCHKNGSLKGRIVLLVDELEQQYRRLDSIVRTDDSNPMREVIARVNTGTAGFHIILAFAPVSFYEFSRGEAQTGRLMPIILPALEPRTFRSIFGEIGNLIWWMGKGRYRGVSRTRDILSNNVSDTDRITRKELIDTSRNLGTIGGVPALDADALESIDDFPTFREYLKHLGPNPNGSELYSGTTKAITRCRIYDNEQGDILDVIEKALRRTGVSKITDIGYYLRVLLDAQCTLANKVPVFTEKDDWLHMTQMAEDLLLEFQGEENLPADDLARLRGNASEFSYHMRAAAEENGELHDGYCISPSFLRALFPFPISSPNLDESSIEEQREALADQTYLGREDRGDTVALFFLNQAKIRAYLETEAREHLKETHSLVAVNPGDDSELQKPPLAQWLVRQGRLKVVTPPRILSDFVVSYCHWAKTKEELSIPIPSLLEQMGKSQSLAEKNAARKIGYYENRIRDYLLGVSIRLGAPKYRLKDATGFADFRTGRVGLVAEVLGFAFVDSEPDLQAIAGFRREFGQTKFVQKESTDRRTGLPTALASLIREDKKDVSLGPVLRAPNKKHSTF